MRIAVVGSGISGLVCARLLSRRHEVILFEAERQLGGHVNTVDVKLVDEQLERPIDTGFIVYNERTYPNFSKILTDLNVSTTPTSMSFSVRCDITGLEYNGTSLNGVFAQRRNLLRPSFHRLLRDILRFNREGCADYQQVPETQTVGEYLAQRGYSPQFSKQYLLPMGAAIWSCPCDDFAGFPIRFILQFYVNHGLLSLRDRPTWRVIRGGAIQYVNRLARPFADCVRLNCPVRAVRRLNGQVRVRHAGGDERFDEIVFACHSDQALRILGDADSLETELLSAFPYNQNTAVLHTDASVLPRQRRAWASWNYHITRDRGTRPTVTYNMNMLQHIRSPHTFCVTLNHSTVIDPEKVIGTFRYAHPQFTVKRASAQRRHDELIRRRHTSFCGAYWRNGFHEDGVVSALAVCQKYGIPDWTSETRERIADRRLRISPPVVAASPVSSVGEQL
ncbi:MAG: NAD(P)/FAD-dependent oxidoreductase [Bythopirellula sp.]